MIDQPEDEEHYVPGHGPDDPMTPSEEGAAYEALLNASEFWVVVGRGRLAFRFGPYTPHEAGKLMTEASERKIAITVIGQCGQEFDWKLADDLGVWLPGHPPRAEEEISTQKPEGETNA